PAPGADARADPADGVGLRLRAGLQLPGRVRDVSAPQNRGPGGAPARAHRARRGLCAARRPVMGRFSALPLRTRLALLTAVAVALAVAVCAVVAWILVRQQLTASLDEQLRKDL